MGVWHRPVRKGQPSTNTRQHQNCSTTQRNERSTTTIPATPSRYNPALCWCTWAHPWDSAVNTPLPFSGPHFVIQNEAAEVFLSTKWGPIAAIPQAVYKMWALRGPRQRRIPIYKMKASVLWDGQRDIYIPPNTNMYFCASGFSF